MKSTLILKGSVYVVRNKSFYSKAKDVSNIYLDTLVQLYSFIQYNRHLNVNEFKLHIDTAMLATITWGFKHPLRITDIS